MLFFNYNFLCSPLSCSFLCHLASYILPMCFYPFSSPLSILSRVFFVLSPSLFSLLSSPFLSLFLSLLGLFCPYFTSSLSSPFLFLLPLPYLLFSLDSPLFCHLLSSLFFPLLSSSPSFSFFIPYHLSPCLLPSPPLTSKHTSDVGPWLAKVVELAVVV